MNSIARVEQIWIKPAKSGPMVPYTAMQLIAGQGIVGNANQGGKRQVTVISRERWEVVNRVLQAELNPAVRRANVLVSGIELRDRSGRVLQIGGCRLRIHGTTHPCAVMEAACPGLRQAIHTTGAGGVYGEVITGGEIRIGDPVQWEASAGPAPDGISTSS